MPDQPSPILVRQAARDLPEDRSWSLRGAPPVCAIGAAFADELYRERRISSVEWRVLRDAIWPTHPQADHPAAGVRPASTPGLDRIFERIREVKAILADLGPTP